MSKFNIRKANNTDTDLIICTIGAIHNEFKLDFNLKGDEFDLTNIAENYFSKNGEFWVAEANGSICGGICFIGDKDKCIEVKRFFLLPGWRNLGLSRLLHQKIIDFAKGSTIHYHSCWIIVPLECSSSVDKLISLGYAEDIASENINIKNNSHYLRCNIIN